jgi:hypothetical protein
VTASFGRPEQDRVDVRAEQAPVPVLHVGEVHAELRLVVSDETLAELGSQIASMMYAATRKGFEAGLAAALGEDVRAEQDGQQDPGV